MRHGFAEWRRLSAGLGDAVAGQAERAFGDGRDAGKTPLFNLRGRKPEALELRDGALPGLCDPRRLRVALIGGIQPRNERPAGSRICPVRRVAPCAYINWGSASIQP
jgi:hypothetical protein